MSLQWAFGAGARHRRGQPHTLSQTARSPRLTWSRQFQVAFLLLTIARPALAADGGFDGAVYGACEEFRDAGPAEQLDGGAWLVPQGRMALVGCRLASCQAAQEATQAPAVAPLAVVLGIGGAFVLGGLIGLAVGYWAPHPGK